MPSEKDRPVMDPDNLGAEFAPALLTVVYIAVFLLGTIAAFRFLVPAILDSHFPGSTFVAAVAGIFCFVALALFGVFAVRHVRRLYGKLSAPNGESTDQ